MQQRQRVRDLADDLALIDVEPQLDARVFEVVFERRRGRLVRARHAQRKPISASNSAHA